MRQFVDDALDEIALAEENWIDGALQVAIAARRNVSPAAAAFHQIGAYSEFAATIGGEVAPDLSVSFRVGTSVLSGD